MRVIYLSLLGPVMGRNWPTAQRGTHTARPNASEDRSNITAQLHVSNRRAQVSRSQTRLRPFRGLVSLLRMLRRVRARLFLSNINWFISLRLTALKVAAKTLPQVGLRLK